MKTDFNCIVSEKQQIFVVSLIQFLAKKKKNKIHFSFFRSCLCQTLMNFHDSGFKRWRILSHLHLSTEEECKLKA